MRIILFVLASLLAVPAVAAETCETRYLTQSSLVASVVTKGPCPKDNPDLALSGHTYRFLIASMLAPGQWVRAYMLVK